MFLFFSWFGVIDLITALITESIGYVVTLGFIGRLAVHRTPPRWWMQLFLLGGLLLIGGLVVVLLSLAHGH